MVVSALLGKTPLSLDDKHIQVGLFIVSGSAINPNKSQPMGTPAPPNADHDSHATRLIIGESFALFFILLFTITRLYVRAFRSHYWGIDDSMIIVAMMGAVVYLSLDIVGQTRGCLGKHVWNCTYNEVAWFILTTQIQVPIFYFTVFAVKLSIAFGNRRITGMASKSWQYIHWGFISLFLCLWPILTIINIATCLPVPANFSLWYTGSMKNPLRIHCLNRNAISLGSRIIHILTDCALLCVPIFIVARLQMPKARKYRLIAIFAIGGMSTIASICRNIFISRTYSDFTYQSYAIYCFDIIDITFAVIVASLPALNGLLESFIGVVKSSFGSLLSGSNKSGSTTNLKPSTGSYQRADDESTRRDARKKARAHEQYEMGDDISVT